MNYYFYFVFLPLRPELWGLDPFALCVSCLVKQSAIFFGVVILLLNVIEVLNVGCCKLPPSSSYFVYVVCS